jgi:hypothetical protein
MKKIFLLLLIAGSVQLYSEDKIKEPKTPTVTDKTKSDETSFNIQFQNQKGNFGKGVVKIKSDAVINLASADNSKAEIKLKEILSVRIKGYTMIKRLTKDNYSAVFYYPYMFDIILNDGKKFTDVKGRIPELESFDIQTKFGPKRFYTYFVRHWLEDKKIFKDNKSGNYYEKPKVLDEVVIYIEFN